MNRTTSILLILVLVKLVFAVSMNDQGNFISDENSENIQYFSEYQKLQDNDRIIIAAAGELLINGEVIANLQNFFTIFTVKDDIYVITRNTIYNLTGSELKPVITFNNQIFDITHFNGNFHVSLKKNIMNGFKFTHNVISESNDITVVGRKILDLRKKRKSNTVVTSPYENYYNRNGNL